VPVAEATEAKEDFDAIGQRVVSSGAHRPRAPNVDR
jgi:hypothetical protein